MTPHRYLLIAAALMATLAVTAASLTLTVNSAENENLPDDRLTLVEALHVANETLGRPVTGPESTQVEEEPSGEDLVIRFAIPGDAPHWIAAPPGGFPRLVASRFGRALVDGYSQPGSFPRGFSGAGPVRNNAVLKIVLDCRVLAPDPVSRIMPDFSFKIARSHTHFRGFSVLASTEFENLGVRFADGAAGGQVSGCWFGVSPYQQILSGGKVAVAAHGTAGGHVIGSDDDGANDAAEANVIAAHAIAIRLEDTRDILVQGNLIGVLPDGVTLPSEAVREALEGDAIEGARLAGTITVLPGLRRWNPARHPAAGRTGGWGSVRPVGGDLSGGTRHGSGNPFHRCPAGHVRGRRAIRPGSCSRRVCLRSVRRLRRRDAAPSRGRRGAGGRNRSGHLSVVEPGAGSRPDAAVAHSPRRRGGCADLGQSRLWRAGTAGNLGEHQRMVRPPGRRSRSATRRTSA